MNRTLFWVASLALLVAAIWLVNGPLQPEAPLSLPNEPSPQAAFSRPAESPRGDESSSIEARSLLLPATSVAEILALSHDFSETHAAYALAATADEAALMELIADAQKVERRNDRVALTSIFVSRYGEIDPAAALEFVLASGFDSKRDHLFILFNGWSKVDLDGALAATIALDTVDDRRVAAGAILSAYTDSNPLTVATIVARLMAAGISGAPAPQGTPAMPSGPPEQALAVAMTLPRDQAAVLVANIGRGWALQDPEAAFEYSRTIEDATLRRRMAGGVFNSWFERDPAGVLGLLDDPLTNDERNALINNNGFVRFVQSEPPRALELTGRISNRANRESALHRVFSSWAEADAAAAASALGSVDSVNIEMLQLVVAVEYARQAPAAALEWAGRMDNGQALPMVIAEVARRDPSLALNASLSMPEPNVQRVAIMQIMQVLADDDVTEAAAFWQRLPAEHRGLAAQGIVTAWAQRDPNTAATWVTGLSPGPDRQQALVSLLGMVSGSVEIRNYPQLLSMLESSEQRDTFGYNRVVALVRDGHGAEAEAELSRISLSAEGYRRAREAIDAGEDAEPRFLE